MERIRVSSSNIKEIGYLLGTLEILFKNNTIYQYKQVPENIYNQLINSSSKGTYFSENIKNEFPCRKIR
ncbi:KTSC domain-containing protein [Polaribacter glomeratus]|uniref:KTSC domain-containing protein n=1 Tax=Polaribacter glomeratus TaxID=102 RepID=A0A2S7WYS7_9FLAO|nr:KTSC domain-containing protein [Polaribacter glomeratus]PQJ82705.1 hypothetical protein BTO16_09005 [Polaribacter glomeratus]TXD63732.1 KTSC domain-containing protein [Polaribacter glomeratus]